MYTVLWNLCQDNCFVAEFCKLSSTLDNRCLGRLTEKYISHERTFAFHRFSKVLLKKIPSNPVEGVRTENDLHSIKEKNLLGEPIDPIFQIHAVFVRGKNVCP